MDYPAPGPRVVAAREALEDLAPRRGRGEGQQARDLLRRKLSEMRPHQRLTLGGRPRAELRPDGLRGDWRSGSG